MTDLPENLKKHRTKMNLENNKTDLRAYIIFLSATWLPQGQLWANVKRTKSFDNVTHCILLLKLWANGQDRPSLLQGLNWQPYDSKGSSPTITIGFPMISEDIEVK